MKCKKKKRRKKNTCIRDQSTFIYMSPSSEDDEARRLALAALSVGDAAEALRLSRYPTSGSGRAKPWVSGCCRFQLLFRSLPLCHQPPGHLTVSLCPHPPTPSLSLSIDASVAHSNTQKLKPPTDQQHWLVAARAHYALGDLRASSQALAEAALSEEAWCSGGGGGGAAGTTPLPSSSPRASISTALIRNNVAAVSLREGKPRCALLCCSLALSPSSQEQHEHENEQQQQQEPSSSSSSSLSPSFSVLPAAIRAAATYNAALASLDTGEDGEGGRERTERAAEELEALARSLDDSGEGMEKERPLVLGRRARARVWLRAAENLARVAAAAEEKEGGDAEGGRLWGRVSAAASRAAALSLPSASPSSSSATAAASYGLSGDPRCRAAALALVAASETRLGRVPEAREAILQALDLDLGGAVEEGGSSRKGDPVLLPGARAALESYLRAMGS